MIENDEAIELDDDELDAVSGGVYLVKGDRYKKGYYPGEKCPRCNTVLVALSEDESGGKTECPNCLAEWFWNYDIVE